jgi:hypothetical protein
LYCTPTSGADYADDYDEIWKLCSGIFIFLEGYRDRCKFVSGEELLYGGAYRLITLMMEAVSSSETSVNIYQITGVTSQKRLIILIFYYMCTEDVSEELTASTIRVIMGAISCSETSVSNQTTRCYIPEDKHHLHTLLHVFTNQLCCSDERSSLRLRIFVS